jgi:hypothetical protein
MNGDQASGFYYMSQFHSASSSIHALCLSTIYGLFIGIDLDPLCHSVVPYISGASLFVHIYILDYVTVHMYICTVVVVVIL